MLKIDFHNYNKNRKKEKENFSFRLFSLSWLSIYQ
jgi:hypothetical protein